MNEEILILGGIILALSIFGYAYAENQQGPLDDIGGLFGEETDWETIASISLAGIAIGAILVIVGLIPDDWRTDNRSSTGQDSRTTGDSRDVS